MSIWSAIIPAAKLIGGLMGEKKRQQAQDRLRREQEARDRYDRISQAIAGGMPRRSEERLPEYVPDYVQPIADFAGDLAGQQQTAKADQRYADDQAGKSFDRSLRADELGQNAQHAADELDATTQYRSDMSAEKQFDNMTQADNQFLDRQAQQDQLEETTRHNRAIESKPTRADAGKSVQDLSDDDLWRPFIRQENKYYQVSYPQAQKQSAAQEIMRRYPGQFKWSDFPGVEAPRLVAPAGGGNAADPYGIRPRNIANSYPSIFN